jgi:hypothetical protein
MINAENILFGNELPGDYSPVTVSLALGKRGAHMGRRRKKSDMDRLSMLETIRGFRDDLMLYGKFSRKEATFLAKACVIGGLAGITILWAGGAIP